MALTPAEASRLATASAKGVVTSARRVAGHLPKDRWLGPKNRYRTATINTLEADDKSHTVRERQLAEYIASSAPLHCCDGWSYLGRAIGCHLHGDPNAARHLAYYAELRAAMALLATQGIGIFNDRHFVVDQNAAVTRLCVKKGTHQATWEFLEAWANLPQASTLLGNVLQPGGRPMSEWVAALPGGASWKPLATDWLLTMGLDLRFLSDDRDARNEASYRPMYLRQLAALPSTDAASVAEEMWHLLEPAPPLSFGQLDRHLLRLSLEGAVRSTRGPRSLRNAAQLARLLRTAVDACVDSESEAALWTTFLLRSDEPDDPRTDVLGSPSAPSVGTRSSRCCYGSGIALAASRKWRDTAALRRFRHRFRTSRILVASVWRGSRFVGCPTDRDRVDRWMGGFRGGSAETFEPGSTGVRRWTLRIEGFWLRFLEV